MSVRNNPQAHTAVSNEPSSCAAAARDLIQVQLPVSTLATAHSPQKMLDVAVANTFDITPAQWSGLLGISRHYRVAIPTRWLDDLLTVVGRQPVGMGYGVLCRCAGGQRRGCCSKAEQLRQGATHTLPELCGARYQCWLQGCLLM